MNFNKPPKFGLAKLRNIEVIKGTLLHVHQKFLAIRLIINSYTKKPRSVILQHIPNYKKPYCLKLFEQNTNVYNNLASLQTISNRSTSVTVSSYLHVSSQLTYFEATVLTFFEQARQRMSSNDSIMSFL